MHCENAARNWTLQRRASYSKNRYFAVFILLLLSLQLGCGTGSATRTPQTSVANGGVTVATPPPSPIPSPQIVFDQIEEMTGWLTCGNCGNTGATGPTAAYQMTRGLSSPSEDGSSAEFQIGGSSPYANAYWYIEHPPIASEIKALTYQFDIYVPSASAAAPQAIEFECQQRLDGWVYNFAWQANYSGGDWRIFDYVNRRWDDSGIPLAKFTPDAWHHIVAEYHTDSAQKVYVHDALSVDGVRYAVNKMHSAASTGNLKNEFTNAFQLDTNNIPTAYNVFVDKMKVTVQ